MAHTPAPWDDASNYPNVPSVRIFARTHYIATVGSSDDPKEVTEANARLIAAAPELLAALKSVVSAYTLPTKCPHDSESDICDSCHYAMELAMRGAMNTAAAVIAKAEGR